MWLPVVTHTACPIKENQFVRAAYIESNEGVCDKNLSLDWEATHTGLFGFELCAIQAPL